MDSENNLNAEERLNNNKQILTQKTLKTLEYNKILQMVTRYAVSTFTHEKILNLIPSADYSEVISLQEITREVYDVYHKYNLRPLVEFDDISEILEKSKVLALLQIYELRRVSRTLRAGRIAKSAIDSAPADIALLKQTVGEYIANPQLEKEIDTAFLSDSEVADNASPKLKDIRRKLAQANTRLKDKLQAYSRSSEVSKFLQDNLVTVRDGRYVLPVKSECRADMPGLIHDRSATGATLFIEPFAVVEMNNEVKALKLDEAAEIERILMDFSARVGLDSLNILNMQDALTKLDTAFSKMHYCAELNATAPKINTKNYVNLIESRHPLIDKSRVVPVTVSVGGEFKILTITGPNTGGKTVCLKTVGLFCLMACSGFWIPAAENSEVAVFDNIYTDIGDEQSIAASLSTFSSHILNIVNITNLLTRDSLVLFDELGAGTDPVEGAALAVGVLKFIENAGCAAMITTHYSELKEYSMLTGGIKNASMQFDEKTFSPTYRLLMGLPGTSNALKIARRLGINEAILNAAYKSLPDEKVRFEKLLYEAENAKRQSLEELKKTEAERYEIQKIRRELLTEKEKLAKKLETINVSVRAETGRLVEKRIDTADELIEELKEKIKAENESALLEAKKIRKKLEDIKFENQRENGVGDYRPLNPAELKAGDEVFVKSLGIIGRVLEVFAQKKEAKIKAGAAVAVVKFVNLATPIKETDSTAKKRIGEQSGGTIATPESKEIHVRGLTVAEAIEVIEAELSAMRYGGAATLRVVHGKGTGALSRGIWTYYKSAKGLKPLRFASYGEGDTGVTIFELK